MKDCAAVGLEAAEDCCVVLLDGILDVLPVATDDEATECDAVSRVACGRRSGDCACDCFGGEEFLPLGGNCGERGDVRG